MKTYIKAVLATITISLLLTSCNHKELYYELDETTEVDVVFDWKNAPDADPSSMVLFMYDNNGDKPLRYIFADKHGGSIHLPYGSYCGLAMNSDNTDWAITRATDDIEDFEIYTPDADQLTAYGLSAVSVPRARGTEDERLALTPGMLWSDRVDNILLPENTGHKIITIFPSEAICHYIVDIIDVTNISSLHGTEIDGMLSGLAEGFLDGKEQASDNKVTMPFVLNITENETGLHSEFLTFGDCPTTPSQHTLSVYIIMADGSKWHYSWDVTEQIHEADDPTHVHIVVTGLSLPHVTTGVGGFSPDVNDWQTEHIGITM